MTIEKQVDLKVDWATYDAAKYACKHWHYSKCVPVGKLVKIGVWEDGEFIGVVIFSRGANRNMLNPYNLIQTEGCELVRIALKNHKSFVSQIISKSLYLLKEISPQLKLIVSYADINQGHLGCIYQATNWIYVGEYGQSFDTAINGKAFHAKTIASKYKTNDCDLIEKKIGKKISKIKVKGKHKYLMPLTKKMRKQILPLSKPYPKQSIDKLKKSIIITYS